MRNTFCFRNFLIFLYTLSSRNREFLLYSSCSISQLFLYYTECCISCKSNDFFFPWTRKTFFFTYGLLLDSWLFHGHGPNPSYSGVVKYIEFSCVREREWILPIYLTILQYLMVRTYSWQWAFWTFILAFIFSPMTLCVCKIHSQAAIQSTVSIYFLPEFLGYNGHLEIFGCYEFKDFLQFRHAHLNSHLCPRQVKPSPNIS